MSNHSPSRARSLTSLRKEAKRWLAALRAGDVGARARFERALPNPPAAPTLRDVQHAVAREHGFQGWAALKRALEQTSAAETLDTRPTLARYETMAAALLEAYRTGTPEAMERHYQYTWHRRSWSAMRTYVQLDLGKRAGDTEITLDEARYLVAVESGFPSWAGLKAFATTLAAGARLASKPVRLVESCNAEGARLIASSRDWDEIITLLEAHPGSCLEAEGQMTDGLLADLARVETISGLGLSACKALTDEGVRQLARMPALKHLDLSGTAITDDGLEILGLLPGLQTLSIAGTRVTDRGAAHLAHCHALRKVNLGGTRTGDGALRALAGKSALHELTSGNDVSDRGIPLLHELPIFKSWQGGEVRIALLSYRALPNHLSLHGSFTDRGMRHIRGLDGLFGLNIDDSRLAITAAALEPLASLPNLGWLGADAKDDWMAYIAELPRLRFLGAQDTVAGDEGFVALSRSRTIEYIWGRRCHNLRRRGFTALANMPALRGLSVSCLNVDDAGIAALPTFPALRELMPMDVPDASYRHIGKCDRLESLILMYCRETTDAATEHITGLRNLSYYFNSYTTITDRTPELLSTMESLERITFDTCHGLTNSGVARLARLPLLRELRVSGRGITPEVANAFPRRVSVVQA